MRTTHETRCTNLFPCKLITYPTFHVCPTFGDSLLIHQIILMRMKKYIVSAISEGGDITVGNIAGDHMYISTIQIKSG